MRVLGIDPGLTRCGLGVVDGEPGRPPQLVLVDVVRTAPGTDTACRLLQIEQAIESCIAAHRPTHLAVERVFAQHNVQTVMGTAQAAGIALLVAARHQIPVALHTPSEVKAAITGTGRAGKQQVGAMVARILRLTEPPRPADAADALALAICHVWRGGTAARFAAAAEAVRRTEPRRASPGPAGPLTRPARPPLAPGRAPHVTGRSSHVTGRSSRVTGRRSPGFDGPHSDQEEA